MTLPTVVQKATLYDAISSGRRRSSDETSQRRILAAAYGLESIEVILRASRPNVSVIRSQTHELRPLDRILPCGA